MAKIFALHLILLSCIQPCTQNMKRGFYNVGEEERVRVSLVTP
jgi:hypothetical protein